MLMPLGGYKGSGLALMVEILCAVLGGGAMSTEVGGIRTVGRPARNSQMFMAIDVGRFMPLDQFQQRMRRLVAEMKSARPAPATTRCWWPATPNGAPRRSAAARASPCLKAFGRNSRTRL